jgi:cell division septation protein DedD
VSDVTVPSYRVARESGGGLPTRMLLIAGGLLAAVAVGGAVVWGIGRMGGVGGSRGVPVIEADSRPIKVRPENPGGLVVPNTDQLVLEPLAVRRAAERQQGANAQLAPQPEAPQLDLLRRSAAPPAPIPGVEGVPDSPPGRPGPGATTQPAAGQPPASQPGASQSSLGTRVAALPPPRPATEAAAPAAPATPAPAATGRTQIQLGALASEEAARAEWARLQRRVSALAGRQPQITRLDRGAEQPPLWRLRTGGLADANAARELCEAVRGAGGACSVVPAAPAAATQPRSG